jgi:hypothetical protein
MRVRVSFRLNSRNVYQTEKFRTKAVEKNERCGVKFLPLPRVESNSSTVQPVACRCADRVIPAQHSKYLSEQKYTEQTLCRRINRIFYVQYTFSARLKKFS